MSAAGSGLRDAFAVFGVPAEPQAAARVVEARLNGLAGDT